MAALCFSIPAAVFGTVLVAASLVDWNRVMATRNGPWATLTWNMATVLCLAVIATESQLNTVIQPLFFGVVALSGLVLDRFKHLLVSITVVAAMALSTIVTVFPGVAALGVQILSAAVVAAATALMGHEFEYEAQRSARRLTDLQRQRADFERLYAVSATLAGAESLAEVLPELVGRICTYLNAQVGVVMLYIPETHELKVMNPIWVTGYPLEAGDITISVSTGGVLSQVFKSGKAVLLQRIADKPENYGVLGDLGLNEAMVAPLKVEQFKVGVIAVGDPVEGTFANEQLEALTSLGAPAALVLSQLGRYEAVAEMTRRLEEVAQMKTDFVSVVSHELRTPLTSIIGSLDTVARPELTPETEAARNLLLTARRQAGRLQRLIEDLLIVSRLERNAVPIQLEPVRLLPFLTEVRHNRPDRRPDDRRAADRTRRHGRPRSPESHPVERPRERLQIRTRKPGGSGSPGPGVQRRRRHHRSWLGDSRRSTRSGFSAIYSDRGVGYPDQGRHRPWSQHRPRVGRGDERKRRVARDSRRWGDLLGDAPPNRSDDRGAQGLPPRIPARLPERLTAQLPGADRPGAAMAWKPPSTWMISPVVIVAQSESSTQTIRATGSGFDESHVSGAR